MIVPIKLLLALPCLLSFLQISINFKEVQEKIYVINDAPQKKSLMNLLGYTCFNSFSQNLVQNDILINLLSPMLLLGP